MIAVCQPQMFLQFLLLIYFLFKWNCITLSLHFLPPLPPFLLSLTLCMLTTLKLITSFSLIIIVLYVCVQIQNTTC